MEAAEPHIRSAGPDGCEVPRPYPGKARNGARGPHEREVFQAGESVDQEISRLASAKEGCVTRAELIAAGVGRAAIEHRLATGRLHVRHRAVYVVGHLAAPPFQRERAALLAAGPDALLVQRSAAFLWGLLAGGPEAVELTVPGKHRRSRDGIRFVHSSRLAAADVASFRGFAVTSVPRVLLDLAGDAPLRLVSHALNESRVSGRLNAEALQALLERTGGRPGHEALRGLLGASGPPMTRTRMERMLFKLVREARLPRPLTNTKVEGHEVDFLWPEERVIAETDGFATHGTARAFRRDRQRDADLGSAGYVVLRVTWDQLSSEPYVVVSRLAATLAVRRRR